MSTLGSDCEQATEMTTLQRKSHSVNASLRTRKRSTVRLVTGLRLDDQLTLWALGKAKEDLWSWEKEFFIDNLEDVDAERAQLCARTEAFKQTSKGQARFRLEKLLKKDGWKSPAEHEEIERLMNQYPEPLHHPKNLLLCNRRPSLEELRENANRDRRIAEEKMKCLIEIYS